MSLLGMRIAQWGTGRDSRLVQKRRESKGLHELLKGTS